MNNPLFGKRPKAVFLIPELKPIERLRYSIQRHENLGGRVVEGPTALGYERMWMDSRKKLHRVDGPALEEIVFDHKSNVRPSHPTLDPYDHLGDYEQVDRKWFVHGELHREDGPAIIKYNGTQEWWVNGITHRTDGPAIVYSNGDQEWHKEGKLHRINGPAVIYARPGSDESEPLDWKKQCEFYIDGEFYTPKEYIDKARSGL